MATRKKPAKRTATVDPNETREHKFIRLANRRVSKVIKDLDLVGNLGSYPHTAEQAERIMGVVQQYVDELGIRLAPRSAKVKAESFEL